MNHTARLLKQPRRPSASAILPGLAAAARDAAALLFVRDAHAFFAPPPAYRHQVSPRARRFMRGGQ